MSQTCWDVLGPLAVDFGSQLGAYLLPRSYGKHLRGGG